MGVREAINNRRGVAIATTVIVVGLIMIFLQSGRSRNIEPLDGTGGFFSDDDGATWFEGDATKIPPWDHKGRTAVRAYVFTFDGGKTKFVGYLERYKPEAKRQLEQSATGQANAASPNPVLIANSIEVKLPKGQGNWVLRSSPKGKAITSQIKSPDGQTGTPELVLP